ncbi:MAG: hypothetical protein BWK77_01350 [Verrucomicrobia bacterium A1]|nr:MAG: hypothetical protein BWK77_01350 [Verrucomicrobia bacterium A1]
MKTSLLIRDEVFREAKHRAAETGRTLGAVVESALTDWLTKERTAPAHRFQWHTVKGRRPPAVSPDDRDALIEFMEGRG